MPAACDLSAALKPAKIGHTCEYYASLAVMLGTNRQPTTSADRTGRAGCDIRADSAVSQTHVLAGCNMWYAARCSCSYCQQCSLFCPAQQLRAQHACSTPDAAAHLGHSSVASLLRPQCGQHDTEPSFVSGRTAEILRAAVPSLVCPLARCPVKHSLLPTQHPSKQLIGVPLQLGGMLTIPCGWQVVAI